MPRERSVKRWALLVPLLMLAPCGGDGAAGLSGPRDDASAVVKRYLDAGFNGRRSVTYDLLHPGIQAKTPRDAFIACASKSENGVITPKVTITESTPVQYMRLDGVKVDATAVSFTLSFGSMQSNFTMWVVDNRLVDSEPSSDSPCTERL